MRNFINKLSNVFIKPLLKSPLHGLASGSLMLITYTGRKSGNIYTTPVGYFHEGDTVTFFTQKTRRWWKNLQGGAKVTLRLKGQNITGVSETCVDAPETIVPRIQQFYRRMTPQQAEAFAPNMVMVQIRLGK